MMASGMRSDRRSAAGTHLVSGHPPTVPASRALSGMNSDMRNAAGAPLVSGHPPNVPALRLSIP